MLNQKSFHARHSGVFSVCTHNGDELTRLHIYTSQQNQFACTSNECEIGRERDENCKVTAQVQYAQFGCFGKPNDFTIEY